MEGRLISELDKAIKHIERILELEELIVRMPRACRHNFIQLSQIAYSMKSLRAENSELSCSCDCRGSEFKGGL